MWPCRSEQLECCVWGGNSTSDDWDNRPTYLAEGDLGGAIGWAGGPRWLVEPRLPRGSCLLRLQSHFVLITEPATEGPKQDQVTSTRKRAKTTKSAPKVAEAPKKAPVTNKNQTAGAANYIAKAPKPTWLAHQNSTSPLLSRYRISSITFLLTHVYSWLVCCSPLSHPPFWGGLFATFLFANCHRTG